MNETVLLSRLGNVTVYPDGAVWDAELVQRVVTLVLIMIATLIGNIIIVLVLSRSRYRKRSSRVNIFILNLAIGDLAVCLFTMTSELLFEVFGEWVLGSVACKAVVYGQIVTLASTTFILTAMSYDRYEAICSPLRSTVGSKQAKKLIAASWLLAFIFAIPQLFIFVQIEKGITESGRVRYECLSQGYTASWQRKLYFSWLTFYILVVPAVSISYCYINVLKTVWAAAKENKDPNSEKVICLRRSVHSSSTIPRAKIKTLKLTVCIIASFIACWTPYFIVHNIRIFSNYTIQVPKSVVIAAETLALFNSALNPVFYGYFNVRVRKGFIEIVYRKKDSNGNGVNESCNGKVDSRDSRESSFSTAITHHAVMSTPANNMLDLTACDCYKEKNGGSPYYSYRKYHRSFRKRPHYGEAQL